MCDGSDSCRFPLVELTLDYTVAGDARWVGVCGRRGCIWSLPERAEHRQDDALAEAEIHVDDGVH